MIRLCCLSVDLLRRPELWYCLSHHFIALILDWYITRSHIQVIHKTSSYSYSLLYVQFLIIIEFLCFFFCSGQNGWTNSEPHDSPEGDIWPNHDAIWCFSGHSWLHFLFPEACDVRKLLQRCIPVPSCRHIQDHDDYYLSRVCASSEWERIL